MWSVVYETLLTTLRLLAPATLLTLFWSHQSFFSQLFHQVERAVKSVIFSSNNQNEAALTWLLDYISPVTPQPLTKSNILMTSLQQVWHEGLLCRALDRAVPGACGTCERDHGMAHAQIVAQQYLGVEPVFTSTELESINVLTKCDEIKFTQYLMSVRTAIEKLSPPVSEAGSPWTGHEIRTYTLDYVARGMGLIQTRNNKKGIFRIYPTAQQRFDPGDISILIRGPQDSHGSVTIPAIYARTHFLQNLDIERKTKFFKISLPLTQGTAYMRSYGETDITKAFYIPKIKQNIDISISMNNNYVKVTYVTKMEGRYEISLISKGCNIVGSPFTVDSWKTSLDEIAVRDFDENDSDTESVDSNSDRKVVFRIVDFVTEKMLLHDNGTLEKISDFEANELISKAKLLEKTAAKDSEIEKTHMSAEPDLIEAEYTTKGKHQGSHFKDISKKILFMVKICKRFQDLVRKITVEGIYDSATSSQNIPTLDTPDIVNSTRSHSNNPRNCSTQNTPVGIYDNYDDPLSHSINTDSLSSGNSGMDNSEMDKFNYCYSYQENKRDELDEDFKALPKILVTAIDENENVNKFEENTLTSKYYSMERPKTPILKIVSHEPIAVPKSPFAAEDADLSSGFETPILPKIFPYNELTESINPVLLKDIDCDESPNFVNILDSEIQAPVADFLIGAPVSLPPLLKAPSPEPINTSLQTNLDRDISKINSKVQEYVAFETMDSGPCSSPLFSTPLLNMSDDLSNNNISKQCHQSPESEHSYSSDVFFTSTDSEVVIEKVQHPNRDESDGNYDESISLYEIFVENQPRDNFPCNEVWDSAYVSIDENNSSPDTMSNKSDITIPVGKSVKNRTLLVGDTSRNEFVMGPAEREIWQQGPEIIKEKVTLESSNPFIARSTALYVQGRTTFTPIDEETDNYTERCNDVLKTTNESRHVASTVFTENRPTCFTDGNPTYETESVSAAFSELSDVFNQYSPNCSITDSLNNIVDKEYCNSIDISSTICIEKNSEGDCVVDSASDKETDVKRRNCNTDESREMELISEVQTFAAESYSASREHKLSNGDNHIMAFDNKLSDKNIYDNPKKTTVSSPYHNRSIFNENSKTSNLVTEKKKYWDEKIKVIEELNETVPFIKKKTPKICRKNDSLGKKRGKNIAITINNKYKQSLSKNIDTVNSKTDLNSMSEKCIAEINLVKKWKHFWDEKVESITTNSNKNAPHPECGTERKNHSDKVNTAIVSTNNLFKTSENLTITLESGEKGRNALPVENSTICFPNKTINSEVSESYKTVYSMGNKYPNIATTKNTSSEEKVSVSPSLMTSHRIDTARAPQIHHDSQLPKADFKDTSQTTSNIRETTPLNMNINNNDIASHKRAKFVIASNKSPKDDDDADLKAFETSPKRFFGKSTSMKNIRQRIDQFLDSSESSSTKIDHGSIVNPSVRSLVADRIVSFGDRCKSLESIYRSTENSKDNTLQNSGRNNVSDSTNYKSYTMLNLRENKSTDDRSSTDKASSLVPEVNTKPVGIPENELKVNSQYSTIIPLNRSYIKQVISMFDKGETKYASKCPAERKVRSPKLELRKYKDETVSEKNGIHDATDGRDISDEVKPGDTNSLERSSDVEETGSTTRSSPEINPEYKKRFNKTKSFFQSLDNLNMRMTPKKKQLNECEELLFTLSAGNMEIPESSGKRGLRKFRSKSLKKLPMQMYSAPTSDTEFDTLSLSDQWGECNVGAGGRKLIKISERFQVEDLFRDVVGDISLKRKGSFRGIPHTQAVLAAFRSMENVAGSRMSSYEISTTHLSHFAKGNSITTAQTHHTDYPYLPTTKPSKCRSRKDAKTYGLISRKELLRKADKRRRKSVPEGWVLNENFPAKL